MTRTLLFAPALLLCAQLMAQAPAPTQPTPAAAPAPETLTDPRTAPNPQSENGRPFHVVREGENLFRIALAYDLAISKLVELNSIKNNTIYVGDKLYLAPPGAKINLPTLPAKASTATPTEPPAPVSTPAVGPVAENPAPSDEDFTFKPATSAAPVTQSGTALIQPRVPRGSMPRPVPASQRTVIDNPASGQAMNANSPFIRAGLPPTDPDMMPLVATVKNLPLLAKDEPRREWTTRQNGYAEYWERQIVRSAGIPASAHWDGQNLWMTLRPAAKAAPVRVVVPGTYLPAEIDTAAFQRWVRAGAVFEFLGHPMYLDGAEPIAAMMKGQLLAPWGFVARVLRVRIPAGPSVVLTIP